jgi:hypothetical protein
LRIDNSDLRMGKPRENYSKRCLELGSKEGKNVGALDGPMEGLGLA